MGRLHTENHNVARIGWLRAAVLGANDGIISTASLIVGVTAAASSQHEIVVAGAAGLMAGAMSMAAGEYVSVSSQSDTEQADLARERAELEQQPESEVAELTDIYIKRGLQPDTAKEVVRRLMMQDALAAHARDERDHHRPSCSSGIYLSAYFFRGSRTPALCCDHITAGKYDPICIDGGARIFGFTRRSRR